jgi:isopenicillin-N epimerase
MVVRSRSEPAHLKAKLFGVRYPNAGRMASGILHEIWAIFPDVLGRVSRPGCVELAGVRPGRIPFTAMPSSATRLESAPPQPLRDTLAAEWMLDSDVLFMNHGCFGARPRAVSEAQQRWRARIEANPVALVDRGRDSLLAPAKATVGRFLGASPGNFGFMSNATGAINAVLRSLTWTEGDEILTLNHVYNAVRMSMRFIAERWGARAVETPLPLPLRSPQQVVDAYAAAITPRTKLVIVDHITSPTAVVIPVAEIIALCEERGVDVLVDGAHAPGMVELDVESLGAAYYAGNLHKWACAPMGAAFLWVRPDRQQGIHGLTISHFYGEGVAAELFWQGTRDVTPWLCAADAIEYMAALPGGWESVRRHNHAMAVWVQAMLCERWGVEPATPSDGSMIGSMTTVPLPQRARERFESALALQGRLYAEERIEVPVIDWDGCWWIRPSCQVYNTPEQYERLAEAVMRMIA